MAKWLTWSCCRYVGDTREKGKGKGKGKMVKADGTQSDWRIPICKYSQRIRIRIYPKLTFDTLVYKFLYAQMESAVKRERWEMSGGIPSRGIIT
jgi:hypothetical protein